MRKQLAVLSVAGLLGLPACQPVDQTAAGEVEQTSSREITFVDIALNPESGIDYRRQRSTTDAIFQKIKEDTLADPPIYYTFESLIRQPEKSRGAPGVAVIDYDNDGDQDLYVTNGPGAANSLYSNQIEETGELRFVDVGTMAGVGATAQDSTGVCFGDIDNDGDDDLYVLGRIEPNRLFENRGDGTFVEVPGAGGADAGTQPHTSCSMGDINGDGLLDIFIANSYDWTTRRAIFLDAFTSSPPNQLFLNLGDRQFSDASESSGIRLTRGFANGIEGVPTISWAGAMVDLDFDGDMDILHADDQGAVPRGKYGGIDRGFNHFFQNDGTGQLTDVTAEKNLTFTNENMGLSFGDFDCNGRLDFFATSVGDWMFSAAPVPTKLGDNSSRWFLQQQNGKFVTPGVGDIIGTPFGWGTSTFDYDNDGDTDIVFYGMLAAGNFTTGDNPGVILANDNCSGRFSYDSDALLRNHQRREVNGVAVGDLNNDGFPDIITVAASEYTEPFDQYPTYHGGPLEPTARLFNVFSPVEPEPIGLKMVWNGFTHPDGDLSVEVNSGNDNHWIRVSTLGTIGITDGGRVNRDGIGATVFVTPRHGKTSILPILGGSSYASQNGLTRNFGLGRAYTATVEILWPGGVRNRLYHVPASADLLFPEIPCSFAADWDSRSDYEACVDDALDELVAADVLTRWKAAWFERSALRAFDEKIEAARRADELRALAADHGVTPIPPAPEIRPELVELGRMLAFDKILSGNKNISCMTCHPTEVGTDDDRHLSRGEGGFGRGKGRFGGPVHSRNSLPLFNLHMMRGHSMFWDSRVRELPDGTIDTPADAELTPEMQEVFEFGIVSAQPMFPVISRVEMLGKFNSNDIASIALDPNDNHTAIWAALMARLGEIPEYVAMFEAAYPGTEFEDMTFAHAGNAIAAFMITAFESRESPWQQFLRGDDTALTYRQMRGAELFFENGCANCHNGPMLTDFQHHNTGLAQFGPSVDDEDDPKDFGHDDFGFANTTDDPADRYKFRTAPLNNIGLTAPYGHVGQFSDLESFVQHYNDPVASLLGYDITDNVADPLLWVGIVDNVDAVLDLLDPLTQVEVEPPIIDFLEALDDPDARSLGYITPERVPSGLPVAD